MDSRFALGTNDLRLSPGVAGAPFALQQQQQQHARRHAAPPSRLHNVHSASQPAPHTAYTPRQPSTLEGRRGSAAVASQDRLCQSPEVIDLVADNDDSSDNGDSNSSGGDGDRADRRPKKRARTDGNDTARHEHAASTPSAAFVEPAVDTAHEVHPGTPLPHLPRIRIPICKITLPKDARTRQDEPARKAHGLEPPSMATRLPLPKSVADFSPWTGHHAEDVLSESVIKSGYFDKSPGPNSTESNSAKPAIWPNLSQKNNMGLQTLSYLFTSVMEKRLALGKCTAPSTFKPPPRVTVTDTKREAWLRDLANPDIPLRKQSRTIPHGIRGKLLMEQCLAKGISMPRALWLAKCVGANELRAFRRKGVNGAAAASGEAKWIREWTVHVEQFLEGVIAMCGQAGWQSKMDYSVKLATSFFSEHLLDRDHYLDWIVSSFAESAVQRLPIWIILVQLYWKNIVAFAKRGRRLAEAILHFLHAVGQQPATKISLALRARLQKLVVVLAVTNRGCLVVPHVWDQYKYILAPSDPSNHHSPPSLDTPARNLMKRNERLTGPLCKTPQNTRCAPSRLYSMLDAVALDVHIGNIAANALAIIPDTAALVHALLDWSASRYRNGLHRVYLTAALIAHLRNNAHDTDGAILEYLQNPASTAIDNTNVYTLLAELVRVDAFSPSRYMQWLITSGILSSGRRSSELATGLLPALPVTALSLHLHNTRQTLLRRLENSIDDANAVSRIEADIVQSLPRSGMEFGACMRVFDTLSVSAKSAICESLIAKAKARIKHGSPDLQTFCHLREVAERSRNIPVLSDLVETVLETDDMALLATVVDTINRHSLCLAAASRLFDLVEAAIQRYSLLRSQQLLDRTLTSALKSLLSPLPSKTALVRVLDNDLAICDQQSSMAVCSPASDNILSMQPSSLDSDDDIDAVFASGNTMDEQLMQRVFARIAQRASKPIAAATHVPSKLCAWWAQLRAVDIGGFKQLACKYLRACLTGSSHFKSFSEVVSTLIASTCVTFNTVLQLANESNSSQAASAVLAMLKSDTGVNEGLHDSERFRYRLQQQRCQAECIDTVSSLLSAAVEDPDFADRSEIVSELLDAYLAKGQQQILKALIEVENPSPIRLQNCGRLVAGVLHYGSSEDGVKATVGAREIVDRADPLSVEHCAAALQLLSKTESSSRMEDSTDIQEAVLQAVTGGCQVWPQLLAGAGKNVMAAVYRWSRDKILAVALHHQVDEPPVDMNSIRQQLDVLDISRHVAKEDDYGHIVPALTEKLKTLDNQFSEAGMENEQAPAFHQLMCSLGVALHLSVLYSKATAADVEATKQHQAHLLVALCNLLVQPNLQRQGSTLEYIYDIAASLSDSLPDPVLHSLNKNLVNNSKDARITSLLGDAEPPDVWLALVSHPPLPGSQQQRMLLKQASNHQAPPPAAPQQSMPVPGRHPAGAPAAAPAAKISALRSASTVAADGPTRTVPFPLRRWEIVSDATPTVGENDTSLSLGLFGARKV